MKKYQILFLLLALTLFSCTKDDIKPDTEQEVQFTFGETTGPNARTAGSYTLDDAKTALLTIETSEGGSTAYENHELPLLRINGALLTEKISLLTGDYQLTGFFLLDSAGNVLYTVPQEGSPLAPHVSDPLPVAFSVSANQAQTVSLEVIRTETYAPADFGLVDFELTEVPVLDFLLAVTEKGTNQLLSGEIQVSNGAYSLSVPYDTITNNVIRIREYEGDYTLTVSAEGYQPQTLSLTADELSVYLNQPLVIELSPLVGEVPGYIYTIAGTGTEGYNGDGLQAVTAKLAYPIDVASDNHGNIFIADRNNFRVRMISPGGIIGTIVGDGGQTVSPSALALDINRNLFIVDELNARVLKKNLNSGLVEVYAGGNGIGYGGDGGPATEALLNTHIRGIALDSIGNLFIGDRDNFRIRKVDAETGIITTIAGTGVEGFNGDNILASEALIGTIQKIKVNTEGDIFFSDSKYHRIRKVDTGSGIISTVAGTGIDAGVEGFHGEGGLATNANLRSVSGMCFDEQGNLYISFSSYTIRKVNPLGVITTIAGTSINGYSGDGGLALDANLSAILDLEIDNEGNLITASHANDVIRKIILN